jgi:chaperonin GroES
MKTGGFLMSNAITPLADYIVAQPEEAETKTASGILLAASSQEKPKTVKVIAVGKDVKSVKAGDRIIHKSFAATEVKVGKDEFIIVKEEDVIATVA